MNQRRARLFQDGRPGPGPVLYWMHRDHRACDNWALLFAAGLARSLDAPLAAVHCLDPAYPLAQPVHFSFLLGGLDELARSLAGAGIPLARLTGDPPREVAGLARRLDAAAVVADFDPLRHKRAWLLQAARALECPLHEVDARNVVPCFRASDKAEYMARTIRSKIHRLLPEFLEEFPPLPTGLRPWAGAGPGPEAEGGLWPEPEAVGRLPGHLADGPGSGYFAPGEAAARAGLEDFLAHRLAGYAARRNDPGLDGQSGLSPWLHFGMLSAQRVALAVTGAHAPAEDKEAFLEELVVRRELADNFCLHHPDYDTVEAFPDWARRTLEKHARDPRPFLYTREELENARTHDPAWNAAQKEMLLTGKMHGYMRMYWGKKILEWTASPREALATALDLNDRYSLDGRDPNGYAGVAWSIGGVHDRPWVERPVFGQVRYMNLAGLNRKFDLAAYAAKVRGLERGMEPE